MKRPISDIVSCSCDRGEINVTSLLKRQKTNILDHEPTTHKSISPAPRVRFATPLVQRMVIPAVVDQEEKDRLFYSNIDFARFACAERRRRDTFVLTITLYREQTRRMRRRGAMIPASSVILMYHKVLLRSESISRDAERKMSRLAPAEEQSKRPTERCCRRAESHMVHARSHIMVAHSA
jgi:hypothetical protein